MTLCLKNNNIIAIHKIIVVLSSHKRLTEVYPRKGWLKNKTKNTFMQYDKNLESCTTITWYVFFLYLDHKAFNTPTQVPMAI